MCIVYSVHVMWVQKIYSYINYGIVVSKFIVQMVFNVNSLRDDELDEKKSAKRH